MSDVKNPDQSIFQALLKLVNGEPPKPAPIKKLPPVLTPGQKIYEKTMTPEFKALEATVDAKAKEKWGVFPKHWLITRYDNPRDRSQRSYAIVYDYIIEASKANDLDPHFLHSVALGEGLMQYIDNQQKIGAGANDRESNVIDSYQAAGLDNLGGDLSELKGYLDDQYFKYIKPKTRRQLNELGEEVLPAIIFGVDTAIFAVSAMLKKCHLAAKILIGNSDAEQVSATLDQEYFIAYALFNNPKKSLPDINALGVKQYTRKYDIPMTDDELKKKARTDQTNIRFNCLVRMATCQRMKYLELYK